MGLFGGGGGSSHTRYKVPKEFRPIFKEFVGTTQQAAQDIKNLGAYQGPWVAGIQPTQTESLAGLENLARSRMAANPADPLLAASSRYFSPDYLNVGADPMFQSALEAAVRPLEMNRADQLNRARAVAAGSGADLGDRAAILESGINTDVNQAIADMAAQAAFGELGRRETVQTTAAPQMYAGALGLQETPSRLLGEVGGTRREFEQETVVEPAMKAFEEQLQAITRTQLPYQNFFGTTGLPFNQSGGGGGGGSSGLGSILSLALGGAGLLL